MEPIHPPGWARLPGYSHGVAARGRTIYLAGQIGAPGKLGWRPETADAIPPDFTAQFRQVLQNIVDLLAEAGARPEHIVKLTWFITDKDEYLAALEPIGAVYRELVGKHYPAMSVIEVKGLVQPGARLEIEATAVVPD